MATLIVNDWSSECSCGYGAGGPYNPNGPGMQGLPVLGPDSHECPGCKERFTERTLGSSARRVPGVTNRINTDEW